jgi:hypothetical protein
MKCAWACLSFVCFKFSNIFSRGLAGPNDRNRACHLSILILTHSIWFFLSELQVFIQWMCVRKGCGGLQNSIALKGNCWRECLREGTWWLEFQRQIHSSLQYISALKKKLTTRRRLIFKISMWKTFKNITNTKTLTKLLCFYLVRVMDVNISLDCVFEHQWRAANCIPHMALLINPFKNDGGKYLITIFRSTSHQASREPPILSHLHHVWWKDTWLLCLSK